MPFNSKVWKKTLGALAVALSLTSSWADTGSTEVRLNCKDYERSPIELTIDVKNKSLAMGDRTRDDFAKFRLDSPLIKPRKIKVRYETSESYMHRKLVNPRASRDYENELATFTDVYIIVSWDNELVEWIHEVKEPVRSGAVGRDTYREYTSRHTYRLDPYSGNLTIAWKTGSREGDFLYRCKKAEEKQRLF